MRFEGRELKPYGEPVSASSLKVGDVYFSIQFADRDVLLPIMETWVYVGRKLDPEDTENRLYFQDVESYQQGVRYESATAENAQFQVQLEQYLNHIFEHERALEQLMACSLRRRKVLGDGNTVPIPSS